jgi:hypothetical protein
MVERAGAMAQSLSKNYVHLIFSTKHRERILPDEARPDLHAYMGGTLKGHLKKRSNDWLRGRGPFASFF